MNRKYSKVYLPKLIPKQKKQTQIVEIGLRIFGFKTLTYLVDLLWSPVTFQE